MGVDRTDYSRRCFSSFVIPTPGGLHLPAVGKCGSDNTRAARPGLPSFGLTWGHCTTNANVVNSAHACYFGPSPDWVKAVSNSYLGWDTILLTGADDLAQCSANG